MMKRHMKVLFAAALILRRLNGLVCCSPSFCQNNSSCHSQGHCRECCCLKSSDVPSAVASTNSDPADLTFIAATSSIPVVAAVKVTTYKDREICYKDPGLTCKLNECRLFKMFVSRKDFV